MRNDRKSRPGKEHRHAEPAASISSVMSGRRELHDRFFRQAKAEGYAARSAYKLIEINNRRRLIRSGDRVADLGCAPGSWVQVASGLVGPRGFVSGIDLKPVAIPELPNARTIVGDVFRTTASELLGLDPSLSSDPRARFDVVLSDMAPSTEGGGGGTVDHLRSIELCRRVLALLPDLLRSGGHGVMKVFEGEEYPALLKECSRMFDEVKGFKPEASRDVSREMFIVCKGFRPVPAGPAPPATKHTVAAATPQPREGWLRR